jgi:hypothetical protein
MCRFVVNGMGTPGVLPPFTAIGLGTPTLSNPYGSGIPSLGAFALASSGALGSAPPGALRGLSNVLLVSNLNEEVRENTILLISNNSFKIVLVLKKTAIVNCMIFDYI